MITIPQAFLRYALGGPLLAVLCLSIGDHGNALGRVFLHGIQDICVWIFPAVMLPPMVGSIGVVIGRRRRLAVRLVWAITITMPATIIVRSGFVQGFDADDLVIAGLAGLLAASGWIVDAAMTRWSRLRKRPAVLVTAALLTLAGLAWIGTGAIDTYREAPPPAYV